MGNELNVIEVLACLMAMKGTIANEDFRNEITNNRANLNIHIKYTLNYNERGIIYGQNEQLLVSACYQRQAAVCLCTIAWDIKKIYVPNP